MTIDWGLPIPPLPQLLTAQPAQPAQSYTASLTIAPASGGTSVLHIEMTGTAQSINDAISGALSALAYED
jgi:hypothetical protein